MPERDKFQMLKDILFWEIPVPFAKARKAARCARCGGGRRRPPAGEELQKAFQSLESQGKDVGSLLLESGLVSADVLEKVRQEQQNSGLSLPMALVRLKVVPAAKINEVIESLNRRLWIGVGPIDSGKFCWKKTCFRGRTRESRGTEPQCSNSN
jgi:hypothetical protein